MRAAGQGAVESVTAERVPAQPAFDLTESKLRPPAARPGIVPRAALLDRLTTGPATPVISVVAPAGYGKTTLLAQWAERRAPRVAWVSVDERDNDPAVLLAHLVAAIDRVEPIDAGVYGALAAASAAVTVPRRLVTAIAAMDEPVALVFDHLEAATNPDCLDAVTHLALGLPPGSQVAIGSRDRLPLPVARLRAQGGIVEIAAADLAMDEREAPALLAGAGVDLPDEDVRDLVRRTEGWPAGLYLAALALTAGSPSPDAALTFPDDDRFVGDYLRAEILDRASPADASFLTRSSILDTMSGPLCDATLAVTGSRQRLEDLEDRNLLVVPLDHRREWYRYHHLFRALLAAELRRREPELVPELHVRAAEWCEAHGQPEVAIDHAQAAGDADRVARLVLALANAVWSSGRADTVHRWLQWFDDRGLAERYPGIAVHGALMLALMGRPRDTERWALAAERAPATGTLPDGNTVEAMVAYMRAILARDGVARMRRDARAALDGLAPGSPYRATMLHTEGVSYLLEGDPDRADPAFARALAVADGTGMVPFVPVVLAEQGLAALARDDRDEAAALAERAAAMMASHTFDDYWTSGLVYAWLARVAVLRGDVPSGREYVAHAARLRHLLTYGLPVVSAQALIGMAHAYTLLGDAAGARAVLRQARDIFQQRPRLGLLVDEADDLRRRLDTVRAEAPGASSLTTAELRLLPLLPTHLTFPEIGERLHVSRHTVKTQASSVYRKLGVSSRGEAIERLYDLGLLASAPVGASSVITAAAAAQAADAAQR
jgi:LuxR family maltose regulon positive regulatory protein